MYIFKPICRSFILIALVLIGVNVSAQKAIGQEQKLPHYWIRAMSDSAANYYIANQDYQAFWKGKEKPDEEENLMSSGTEKTKEHIKRLSRKEKRKPYKWTTTDISASGLSIGYWSINHTCKRTDAYSLLTKDSKCGNQIKNRNNEKRLLPITLVVSDFCDSRDTQYLSGILSDLLLSRSTVPVRINGIGRVTKDQV
jgi:hypothetical protein